MRAPASVPQQDLVAAEVQRLFDGIEERPIAEREALQTRVAAELARVRAAVLESTDFEQLARRAVFEVLDESSYRLSYPGIGVELTLDHVRRERQQLVGELAVRCTIAGARTFDDVLSIGDFTVGSVQARSTRAKHLAERARTGDQIDWAGLLEELAQRTLAAERAGRPSVLLSDLPRPAPDETIVLDGIPLLARHPMILFGDGDSTKSYLALYLAGCLARRGRRVALFDWELSSEDHRERLGRLFPDELPPVRYQRLDRPLFHIAESVHRLVRDHSIEHAFFDSVAFACDGPPEAAEVAGRYFQSVRGLGAIGTVHVAHVSKALEGADLKPFGSAFWHNGARSTWNVKRAEAAPGDDVVSIVLHHRKSNLGRRMPSIGFEFLFAAERTTVRRIDPAGVPDLAASLSLIQRVKSFVRTDARTREEIEFQFEDIKPATLRRALDRALEKGSLVRFPGPKERIGLPYRGPQP